MNAAATLGGTLLLALILTAWGAQAVVPWALRHGGDTGRRYWGFLALPAALAGALAALLYLREHSDAALAAQLFRPLATVPGRLLALLFPVLLLVDGLLLVARQRLEDLGWKLAAGLALPFGAAAGLAAELVRTGEGPAGTWPQIYAAAAIWLIVALAAGELLAPGREEGWKSRFALPAGLIVPAYFLTLPGPMRQAVQESGAWITLGIAALLLLAVRWLPPALRRPGLAAAVLLAALFLERVAGLGQSLANRPFGPLPIP